LALAQKSGGILKMPDFASPASMSIHEEVTRAAVTVLMPVFNNLVLFDQHKEKNTLDTIVPDLAESWNLERGRQGADLQVPARGQLADTPNPHHSREPGRGIF
jgi:ABC-type transport system substrate-binding protein